MLLLVDNYDSFTYNLYHYLGELGATTEVWRNDALSVDQVLDMGPEAIVLSPGPCTPNEAGICLELIDRAKGRIPILGVCLGHQAIAQAFGATVARAPRLMHGKTDRIAHDGTGVFKGLPDPFTATRYHSLCALPETVPDCLVANASSGDGVIMGLRHREFLIHGVQFHPESIETTEGKHLLRNFLELAGVGGQA
ncbi:MAG TPA: aminodeoxychorismate/anthranilate synthase component II [Geminicoccus sp.]|uniref:anthranilate synthase component II n=1 Tax=Geminicoccus sp. TaxID=2024832 RepID=UPI002B5DF004|nr:aminodeoxychorismate/anthranilate synthase component II [Geminicoccus sp.]HWL70994.1 aminodeoxychorismate/anthranilate synthase component II [Geminicoccus sp.]